MNSSSASNWVRAILANHYVTSVLLFGLWIAAVMSGSVFAILAGLVVYARPLLYVKLLNSAINTSSAKSEVKNAPTARTRRGDLVLAN